MSVISTILQNIGSIVNVYTNKFINTGDRLLDHSLIVFISTLNSILMGYIPKFITKIEYSLYKTTKESIFIPNKVDLSKLTEEDIYKYKYKIKVSEYYSDLKKLGKLTDEDLHNWIIKTYGDITSTKALYMYYSLHSKKLCLNEDVDTYKYNLKMPIYRYFKGDNPEYIIYYGQYLYCNNLSELEKFIKPFFKTEEVIHKDKSIFEVDKDGKLVNKGKINLNKSFDKLHFKKKKEILDMLDKFRENRMYPPGLSLDNKLGVLLYGPPGTAKTATCVASAIYLDRNILILSSLLSLPRDKILDIVQECKDTHVIILDEFDHILSRKAEPIDYKKLLADAKTPSEIAKAKQFASECKISDEEFILKLLDGIADNSKRAIFATTNSIDRVNPKFLRPGRFDVVAELAYCDIQMFNDIVSTVYKDPMLFTDNYSKIEDIIKMNVVPVNLINAIIRTSNFSDMLEMLINGDVDAWKRVKIISTKISVETQTTAYSF